MIKARQKFTNKWSLYGMYSFHFYHWNQIKVIPLACTLRTRNIPNFLWQPMRGVIFANVWHFWRSARVPCAVKRDTLRSWGSNLSLGVSAYQTIISNNAYPDNEQGDNPGQEKKGSALSSINCDHCWRLHKQCQDAGCADISWRK